MSDFKAGVNRIGAHNSGNDSWGEDLVISGWLDSILMSKMSSTQPGAPPGVPFLLPGSVQLPDAHAGLLNVTNGLLLYDGYFRLFGINGSRYGDLSDWNHHATWKFAWPDDLSSYLCFGETAWGDQYAYEIDLLRRGVDRIVFLDALRMQPRVISGSFDEFASRYLTRNSIDPYDSVLKDARDKLGALRPGEHLVFSPPTIISGEEDVEQLMKIGARDAMILNGDLWTQLRDAPLGAAVAGLKVDIDDQGRERATVIWA